MCVPSDKVCVCSVTCSAEYGAPVTTDTRRTRALTVEYAEIVPLEPMLPVTGTGVVVCAYAYKPSTGTIASMWASFILRLFYAH